MTLIYLVCVCVHDYINRNCVFFYSLKCGLNEFSLNSERSGYSHRGVLGWVSAKKVRLGLLGLVSVWY